MTKRAAVYLRISLDRSGEGVGVDRQREACMRLLDYKGWNLVGEYVDNSVSATKRKPRPEYERLLSDVRAGLIDVVVVYKVDRLTRRPIEIEDWIELNRTQGVSVSTVEGDLDLSTPTGRQVAGILANIARGEMETKSDRQKAAHVQRARTGQPWLTRRPFGFEADGITHRPDEAEHIRRMYADLLAGVSQSALARDLNERGMTTSLGNAWRQEVVRQLLLNPRNAGLRAHRGEIVGQGSWEPIVTENVYRAAVALLTTGQHPGGGAAKHLLTGVAECGVCGSRMRTAYTARGVRMYACSTGKHTSRNADRLDAYVTEFALALLTRPDASDLMRDQTTPDVTSLAAEAEGYRTRLDALAVEYAEGNISASQMSAGSERLQEKLRDVERRMSARGSEAVLGPLLGAADIRRKWESFGVDRRREAIRTLTRVVVNPTRKGSRFNPDDIEFRPVTDLTAT